MQAPSSSFAPVSDPREGHDRSIRAAATSSSSNERKAVDLLDALLLVLLVAPGFLY